MKKLNFLVLILIFALPLMVSADPIEETREVDVFTQVDLYIAGTVYLKQGDNQKVVVKGEKKDIEELITEVKNGALIIRYEGWFSRHGKIEIFVEMKNIEGLDVSGSGSIVAESKIVTNEIELEISGSGSVIIDELAAKKIENEISGSGRIMLKGVDKAEVFDFEISGSGKINAFDLTAMKVSGEISGSGKVEITAESRLEVEISGSGKVYYKGNPIVDAEISGSGKVVSEN